MPGSEYFNQDIETEGKIIVKTVPNSPGTVLIYNPVTKEISTRSNTEIISDLGLNTGLTNYVKKAGDTMTGPLVFDQSTSRIRKDLSGITTSGGFARTMYELVGSNGLIDLTGWFGTVDTSGNVTMNYGFLGGTAYNGTNALRWNSAMQVAIGGNIAPTGNYTLEVVGNSLSRGSVNAWGTFNTTSGELQVQRLGVNRIRTNTNSTIISGDQSNGIVYIRPQGDAVSTAQIMVQGNNTSQYTDNHNILMGTQTSVGGSLFHTNVSNTIQGYGMWMAYNLQYNGTDFIQPRGTGVSTYAFTANQHKGFSFNYAGPTGANGNTVTLTEVVRINNTGTITTLNHGDSSQWKAAYDTLLNAVTTNTTQNITAIKTFTVMQKFREGGLKFFEGNTLSPYLNKYENKAVFAPTASSATGNLKISFPFTMQATMWSLKVKVLQYVAASTNTKTAQIPMDITITGYNVSAGSGNVNWGASGNNFHNNFVGVRIGFDSTTNNKIVWLDFNATLNYPKVIIEEIITHHAGSANSLLDGNWDIQFTTDETNYTHQSTVLLADFKELVTDAKTAIWDAAGAEVGNNLKILGNGVGKHNLLGIDAFTTRNASQWAGAANRPVNTNSAVVNFTPYSSGGSTYGFSLGARNNRLFFVTEEASVFGSWLEIYHSGNLSSAVITSNTNQTGLTGDKTTAGNWIFNGTGATGITLLRPGSAINNSMAFGFDTPSHYVGLADANIYALGNNANLALANRHFWIDTSSIKSANLPGQIGGSSLASRDLGGFTITTTTNTNKAEMILRHVWSANNKTYGIGGTSSGTSGSMSQWGLYRWLNDRTVNGNDGFFGWTGDVDVITATSLAGTGTRMVVASSGGQLSTVPLMASTDFMPVNHGNPVNSVTYQGDLLNVPAGSYVATVSGSSTNAPFTASILGGLISFGQLGGVSTRILGARDNSDNLWFQSGAGTGAWRQLASRDWTTNQLTGFAKLADTQTFTGQNTFNQPVSVPDATNVSHAVNLGQMTDYVDLNIGSVLNYVANNYISNSHAANSITTTLISNWNNAYNFTSNFATNYNDLVAIEALAGTNGYLRKDGNGQWSLTASPVTTATASVAGVSKLFSDVVQTVASNTVTSTASRTYGIQFNSSGQMVVNIPWTDTIYTLPSGSSTVSGGQKLFNDTVQTVAGNAVTTTAGRTYGIQIDSNGRMVVNVPWVDTNTVYTLPTATSSILGGTKLASDTVQTIPIESISSTTKRTYGIQFNSSGQMVVNVPWVDTNTTYSAGTGLTLTTNSFSVSYGTTAGTAAQGNDSRINNGQTAFSWGNHGSAGYVKINQSFSTNTTNNIGLTDDYAGGETALYDISNDHIIAGKDANGLYKFGSVYSGSGGVVVDPVSGRMGYGGVSFNPSFNHYFNGTIRIAYGISSESTSNNDVLAGDGNLYQLDKEISKETGSLRLAPFDRVYSGTFNTVGTENRKFYITLLDGGTLIMEEMFQLQEVVVMNCGTVDANFIVNGTSVNVLIPIKCSATFYKNGQDQIILVRMDENYTGIVG